MNISDHTIIPPTCRERFAPHAGAPGSAGAVLAAAGILHAGLSELAPGYVVARARPGFHAAFLTLAGTGRWRTADGEGTFAPGRWWLAPAGCAHQYRPRPAWRVLWFHLADRAPWLGLRGDAPREMAADGAAGLLAATEGLLAEAGRDASAAAGFARLLAALLARELAGARMEHDPRLARLAAALSADLARPWPCAALARIAGCSPTHCHRLVAAAHGCGPAAWVARLRLERADALLRSTPATLATVATAVGYESPFALSRAYKRRYGGSPAERRRAPG